VNDEFEELFAKRPLRPIPAEWRADILRSARSRTVEGADRRAPRWQALLWPSPIAWACVLGAWLLIAGMNFASRSPVERFGSAPGSEYSPDAFTAIMQESELDQEFSQFETQPAAPPPRRAPSGACNDRRRQEQMETT
jgi:hypothetical protein